jgi:plasmid stabilization system protein ParE
MAHYAPEIARRFKPMLQRALTEISLAPERWPTLVDDLRKRPQRGFPYRIVYQLRQDHVLIVAVMHERRRPNYWRERV